MRFLPVFDCYFGKGNTYEYSRVKDLDHGEFLAHFRQVTATRVLFVLFIVIFIYIFMAPSASPTSSFGSTFTCSANWLYSVQ